MLNPPHPDWQLPKLISQALHVPGSKSSPSVIATGVDLNALHLITLFCEDPHISIKQVGVSINADKKLLSALPFLERREGGSKLVVIDLHNGSRVVEDPVEIRPLTDRLGGKLLRGWFAVIEASLILGLGYLRVCLVDDFAVPNLPHKPVSRDLLPPIFALPWGYFYQTP